MHGRLGRVIAVDVAPVDGASSTSLFISASAAANARSDPSPFAPALWSATRSREGAGTGRENETRSTV